MRGELSIESGPLLGVISLRPLIWSSVDDDFAPIAGRGLHAEYEPPIPIANGAILAMAEPSRLNVGGEIHVGSVFELVRVSDSESERMEVDLEDSSHIRIRLPSPLYDVVSELRRRRVDQAIVMNAVYLPAVMEVVSVLRAGSTDYRAKHWYSVIEERLHEVEASIDGSEATLTLAQALMADPLTGLKEVAQEEA